MNKVFAFLMVAMFATAMVSCSKDDKDNNGGGTSGGGGSDVASVDGTLWRYETGTNGQPGYVYAGVGFDYGMASVNITTNTTGENEYQIYAGPYTYSNGSGTINMMDVSTGASIGTATFTINGTNMTLNALGGTYTLAKQ